MEEGLIEGRQAARQILTGGNAMGDLSFDDRRLFYRFPVCLPLQYTNLAINKTSQAITRNISANGIGIVTGEALHPSTPLDIHLSVPDNGQPLHTKGNVVWMKEISPNKYMIGISLCRVELMAVSRILSVSRQVAAKHEEQVYSFWSYLRNLCSIKAVH